MNLHALYIKPATHETKQKRENMDLLLCAGPAPTTHTRTASTLPRRRARWRWHGTTSFLAAASTPCASKTKVLASPQEIIVHVVVVVREKKNNNHVVRKL